MLVGVVVGDRAHTSMVHLALVTPDAAGRAWTPPYSPLSGLPSASNRHQLLDSSVLPVTAAVRPGVAELVSR